MARVNVAAVAVSTVTMLTDGERIELLQVESALRSIEVIAIDFGEISDRGVWHLRNAIETIRRALLGQYEAAAQRGR